jgi:putative transcriptional regulator
MSSLKGRLLVALPPLNDQNFNRTVVLMLEHTDEGALGVVVFGPSAR